MFMVHLLYDYRECQSQEDGDRMNTTDAIRHMMSESGMSASAVSTGMGKVRTYVTNTLSRGKDATAGVLASMAEVMGYELVLRGRDEEIVIDARGEDGDR